MWKISRYILNDFAPKPTENVSMSLNLRPDDPLNGPFDPNNPDDTSSIRISTVTFDSIGNPHEMVVLTLGLQRTSGRNAVIDGGELAGGTEGDQTLIP